MITMNMSIEFARKMSLAYNMGCKSLCQELKLPQTAFDILMFLANNPSYKTASDIVEIRKIKGDSVPAVQSLQITERQSSVRF